jgi:hypothetical protein
MIHQLSDQVYFGDGHSPYDAMDQGIQLGAVINVAHHLRRRFDYFARMKNLPHEILYFRIARKDAGFVDDPYAASLMKLVDVCTTLGKLPILAHCQLGGHRGPTTGIFVAWYLAGQTAAALEQYHAKALELVPSLARGRNFYKSGIQWMKDHSA